MIALSDLPAVNATLNATSGVLVTVGYVLIRQKRRTAHAVCMISATVVSALFLASYVYYHAHVGTTRFLAHGLVRHVYHVILTTHTALAVALALWLVPVTVVRAARRRFDRHKTIARWTLPIWLYVSVTGVVIYLMLYHWYART